EAITSLASPIFKMNNKQMELDQLWRCNSELFNKMARKFFVIENVLWLTETDDFSKLKSRKAFVKLYKRFIKENAPFELNLSSTLKKSFLNAIFPQSQSFQSEQPHSISLKRISMISTESISTSEISTICRDDQIDFSQAREIVIEIRVVVLRLLYDNMRRDLLLELKRKEECERLEGIRTI
ncbi:hypothetical protein HK096_002129, partial [Nowakowskiella sp. JEL0078]